MKDQNQYLEHLLNSREFILGSRLRQSFPFKLFRHIRFKDRMAQVRVLGIANSRTSTAEVCLLGVWYEDFPDGMPLEFLERTPKKWRMVTQPASPYNRALLTTQKDTLRIYSQHENLRLDFLMDQNSGEIQVEANGMSKVIELYSPRAAIVSVYPNHRPIKFVIENQELVEELESNNPPTARFIPSKNVTFASHDLKWLELQCLNKQPLSVNNPAWRGVLASAQELFDNIYQLSDNLDWDQGVYYARLFQEADCPLIILQGFPPSYRYLVKALRKIAPRIPVYVIYHGNFLHMREDYEWSVFKTIRELHTNGDIQKIGFIKKGMAEIMSLAGVRSAFIMNMVRCIPNAPSQPLPDGVHAAIWSQPDWSWKKSPYAMLAALRLVPEAVGHVYNVSSRAREFGDLLSIRADYVTETIPQEQVLRVMAQMHVNLYVTLTECAPMLPLQSLSVGVPCLFGPTTHYFRDHDYLQSRLVVPYPDQAEVIAEKANLALAERNQVIEAYRAYAPEYNRQARRALENFLEFPIN